MLCHITKGGHTKIRKLKELLSESPHDEKAVTTAASINTCKKSLGKWIPSTVLNTYGSSYHTSISLLMPPQKTRHPSDDLCKQKQKTQQKQLHITLTVQMSWRLVSLVEPKLYPELQLQEFLENAEFQPLHLEKCPPNMFKWLLASVHHIYL